jgi:molecular chaperone DnaK (HSP70)
VNYKKFKTLPAAQKHNEIYYVIGLDIGNDSSAIAFYNLAEGTAETIDLSGGYGKPSIPTAMQYISETKEWVFGEYAVLNRGVGTVFSSLLEKMGRFDYLSVDGRSLSVASVFALFIKEILASVKSINPKAEIVGIVASVPAYFSAAAHEEFTRVFKLAGYEKELIALVPDRECVLAHHYRELPEKTECALLVDLGNRELRGGLYNIETSGGGITAVSMSSVFDSEISMAALNSDVNALFESFLSSLPKTGAAEKEQLLTFTHQHKDILFQKNIRAKPQKLYFNFVYPPVQHSISHEQVEKLIKPYALRFERFLNDVLEKNLFERRITPAQVDAVLCVGGGFEMLWAKEAVTAVFPKERVKFYKNHKLITSEGAAIIAARELEISGVPFTLEDKHQLTNDIGLSDGENFLTLVERNGFWWQKHPAKLILVNSEVNGEVELQLSEFSPTGEGRGISKMQLNGLPKRPKGVTRLEVSPDFRSNTELIIRISDIGFGDLFPRTDYVKEFLIKI